jgi:hypothetical protein
MTLTFHALWMVCALGAAVFAAAAHRRVRDRVALIVGFIAGLALVSPTGIPDVTVVGFVAAGAAALYLFRPRFSLVAVALGGSLGGVFASLLQLQGLPSWLALAVAAALLVVPVHLAATRPAFAPDVLRDEGLLAIAVVALTAAMLPGVLDGWQAAANLAATTDRATAAGLPLWTLALLLVASCLGALYSSWSRR